MRIIVGIAFAVGSVVLAGCCLWRQATGEPEPLPPSPPPPYASAPPSHYAPGPYVPAPILDHHHMHQRHPQTHNMKTEVDMKIEEDMKAEEDEGIVKA